MYTMSKVEKPKVIFVFDANIFISILQFVYIKFHLKRPSVGIPSEKVLLKKLNTCLIKTHFIE